MKTISLAILFTCLVLSISCSNKDTTPQPCDNNGTICFNNKTDSLITVSVKEAHTTITTVTIAHDVEKCLTLSGEVTYSINMSGTGFNKDTTILLLSCDKKEIIVR
jgi:hypothetical protein